MGFPAEQRSFPRLLVGIIAKEDLIEQGDDGELSHWRERGCLASREHSGK